MNIYYVLNLLARYNLHPKFDSLVLKKELLYDWHLFKLNLLLILVLDVAERPFNRPI